MGHYAAILLGKTPFRIIIAKHETTYQNSKPFGDYICLNTKLNWQALKN